MDGSGPNNTTESPDGPSRIPGSVTPSIFPSSPNNSDIIPSEVTTSSDGSSFPLNSSSILPSTSTATTGDSSTIIESEIPPPSATQTPAVTVAYGTDLSFSATQSLGSNPAVNTTTSIVSHLSESSNIGPIVGGVLGFLALILVTVSALLCLRRRRRKHRIAPSSEYLASQYPYIRNPQVQQFADYKLISSREHLGTKS